MAPIPRGVVTDQLAHLGVRPGGVLLVHTSFRPIAPIEDGPRGLISALRAAVGDLGTLVMPTMTDGRSEFDPASTPTDGMGITAETFWRLPGVVRSSHPGGSFAAAGPHAEFICRPQPLAPPHGPDSPVGRVHELGGQVLLLGIDHSANTTLHLAEAIAGVPYSISHPCVVRVDGVLQTLEIPETDHCCRNFALMDDWLRARGLQREGPVGHGRARLCESRDLVTVATERLRADPLVFLCAADQECEECEAARASVP
jgi:aminoglycoside 3-N-acetyltransferase